MNQIRLLHDGWQITQRPAGHIFAGRELSEGDWYPARRMPAQVHDILLENGVIENEALKGRCDRYDWVAKSDWIYRCTFSLTNEEVEKHALLRLRGLDTLVDVYLQGELLLSHRSMYRAAEIDLTGKLGGENTLLLHFHSPFPYLESYQQPAGYTHEIKPAWSLRKCSEDFTRYLGAQPRQSVPIGVFDNIELHLFDAARIEWMDLETDLTHDFSMGTVEGRVHLEVARPGNYELHAAVTAPDGRLIDTVDLPVTAREAGMTAASFALHIPRPELWWPNGLGPHPLYTVEAGLSRNGALCEKQHRQIGLRSIRSRALFDFTVNGKAVKLWGGNLCPVGREGISHVYDAEKAELLLDLVENGMNCMRVWGPGVPFPDELYDSCDRRGILLWQEFYGHSNLYPETEDYYAEACADADDLVKRLKHHPSILLWCGGNESTMWADIEDPKQHVYGKSLYFDEYRRICSHLDPRRFYYPTCPMLGEYPNDPLEGDTHGLEHRWWFVPGCDYPYFFSENTRVSPSGMKSLTRFMTLEEIWPDGFQSIARPGDLYQIPPAWIYYSAEEGNAMWDKFGPVERFYTPTNAGELVYTVAAARALHFHEAVERCRRGRPHDEKDQKRRCFGHLVWKLNDTLPQIYSAVIDYFVEPYIPYYAMVRAYAPVLISFEIEDFIHVWVVNDSGAPVCGNLTVRVFDTRKNCFVPGQSLTCPVTAGHDESICVTNLNAFGMIWRQNILYATLESDDGEIIASATEFLTMERYFDFPQARLTLRQEGEEIVVTTDRFAHCIELEGNEDSDRFNWLFSENYFDLLPGMEKRVRLKGRHHTGVVTAKAQYSEQAAQLELS